MAKEYGIRLNRKHLGAPDTPKGHIWVDKNEEDQYTTRNNARRWKNKADAKRAYLEPWDEIAEL